MISSVMLFLANLRIEIEQPSIASGGAMISTPLYTFGMLVISYFQQTYT